MNGRSHLNSDIEGIRELRQSAAGWLTRAKATIEVQLKRLPKWAPYAAAGIVGVSALILLTRKASASTNGEAFMPNFDVPPGINWFAIVKAVAEHESGGSYGAFNPDDRDRGISWGLLQFNQNSSLGAVLKAWKAINASEFYSWAGGESVGDDLLKRLLSDEKSVRLGIKLNTSEWTAKFKAAGKIPNVKIAQQMIAFRDYGKPLIGPVRGVLGLTNQTLAVAFDRAIQQGPGRVKESLNEVAGKAPIGSAEIIKLFKDNVIAKATKRDIPRIYARFDKVWKNTANLV